LASKTNEIKAFIGVSIVLTLLALSSCSKEKEHTAPAIYERDSVSVMTSYGVNTLISDSGVIKYKIVTERWDVNTVRTPSRWTFIKGVFFEQFDEQFRVQAYVQADTAWYYDQKKLWELRGRVRVRNVNGMRFSSEELFWDGMTHELYSNKYSVLYTPERTLQGTYFRSDEKMTRYTVSNSQGSFVKSDVESESATPVSSAMPGDTTSVEPVVRPAATKRAAAPKNPLQP
jgi:LPS export ABC transporter protein LptC